MTAPPESDAVLLTRVAATLGVPPVRIAERVGMGRETMNSVMAGRRKFSPAARREVRRLLANEVAADAVNTKTAGRLPPCRGVRGQGIKAWAAHFLECPTCLVRHYTGDHLTQQRGVHAPRDHHPAADRRGLRRR